MSTDLRDLYQEIILEHSRKPHNSGHLDEATYEAQGNNPLCGDRISIYVKLDGDCIQDAMFEARGCAISVASASMMTDMIIGMTVEDAKAASARFQELITDDEPPQLAEADQLAALMGVRDFPTRIKCATLPWETFGAALDGGADEVTTE